MTAIEVAIPMTVSLISYNVINVNFKVKENEAKLEERPKSNKYFVQTWNGFWQSFQGFIWISSLFTNNEIPKCKHSILVNHSSAVDALLGLHETWIVYSQRIYRISRHTLSAVDVSVHFWGTEMLVPRTFFFVFFFINSPQAGRWCHKDARGLLEVKEKEP